MSKHTTSKSARLVIICCSIVIVLFLSFWLLIHPFASFLFLNGVEHESLDVYTDEKYLQYPGGEVFQHEIAEYSFVDECEATGFYHVNNWPKDNLFYGKICDVFCLELDALDKFESVKSTIHTNSQQTLVHGNWAICLLTQPSPNNDCGNYFFIATNDENRAIRCLLIVDFQGDITLDFRSLFVRYTSLEW